MEKQKILKAGEIAKQVKIFARSFIKPGMKLLDIAEKIEAKIHELGGKVAFPTNLSINEVAAHCTPSYNDDLIAKGLLKVDIGVHVDGGVADTAFSIDMENNSENKKLIIASEKALKAALEKIKKGVTLGEIGKVVQESIESESEGFTPISNLYGHQMEEYELHAGMSIPSVDNKMPEKIEKGLYAIEPFATNGTGRVIEGKPSGIYLLQDEKNIRNSKAREILNFIIEEYRTLPFCSRWIVKKFGTASLFALKQLEENQNLYQYPQLVEVSKSKVSQSENTVLVEDKTIITTE